MQLDRMLADLRQERENLNMAIVTLERLATNGTKRRGRPPSWMKQYDPSQPDSKATPISVRKPRRFTKAQREEQAKKMKAHWAKKKKEAANA